DVDVDVDVDVDGDGDGDDYFTLVPAGTSASTVTNLSPSLGPVANSIPCDTKSLPNFRGSRFATTITLLPTSSSGRNDSASPATMARGSGSPTSTRNDKS